MPSWLKTWPHGKTWVFQGTVAEDATGGTHVCSLTVTPGAGNEMQLLYGIFIAGAGAANLVNCRILDGTNLIADIVPAGISLASGQRIAFPTISPAAPSGNITAAFPLMVSGTMQFSLTVSTATTGLTHTFAVACRIMGALPTATLADSVGTPVLTTNTNQVF